MEKNTLKQIILEQKKIFEKDIRIVYREVPDNVLKSNKIIVITGIRRCGKSTLLRQLSKHYKDYHYFNFEDERLLDFTYVDFNTLLEAFLELNADEKTIFLDKIQEINGWEKFVRRLFNDGYKVYVTGSNAKLLSSEIATSLTGRNLKIELFPFSFKEYLSFVEFPKKSIYTTKEKSILSNHIKDYIKYGGFPEIINSKDNEELNQIYQDIIIKDLLVRYKIRDAKDFRELALYLLTNVSKKMSFNNLKSLLGFSNTSKVKNYIDFLSEAYLFFCLFKYDASVKKQLINDRKIYAIDTGMINTISFQFSENFGRILENMVFLELKRNNEEIYYYENKKECDFLVKKGNRITNAIQVAVSISDPITKKREIEGLHNAMDKFKLKEGILITESEEKITGSIKVIPLWKFLLK